LFDILNMNESVIIDLFYSVVYSLCLLIQNKNELEWAEHKVE
jgi:hypothetical protein